MTVVDDGCQRTAPAAAAMSKAKYLFAVSQATKRGAIEAWPTPSTDPSVSDNAYRRGRTAIKRLVAAGYIDIAMALRGRELIEVLFTSHTIDASIAPDDGGLIFYWAARDMAITVEIYPSAGYWWSVRNIGTQPYSGSGTDLPLQDLRYSLNQFTKEVERQNPNWRSVVR